jgi:hypothetical protein
MSPVIAEAREHYVEGQSYSFKRGPNAGAVKASVGFETGMGGCITLTIHEDDSLSIDLSAEQTLKLVEQAVRCVAAARAAAEADAAEALDAIDRHAERDLDHELHNIVEHYRFALGVEKVADVGLASDADRAGGPEHG